MLRSVLPFDSDLVAACGRFEQGHLLLNPLTAYVARAGVVASSWATDHVFPNPPRSLEVGGVGSEPEPPFFIIRDQTCDVQKLNIPFIHASPVFNGSKHFKAGEIQRIRSRTQFLYYYAVTAPNLKNYLTNAQTAEQERKSDPDDWAWLVDLRIQIPLDKGVLVGRDVISAFASREDQIEFGQELGHRADRPALPTVVDDEMIPALERAVIDAEESLRGVQFRVITDSISNPTKLELVLITPHTGIDAETIRALIGDVVESVGNDIGVPCSVRSCGTDREVCAADYRDSNRIDINLEQHTEGQ